MSENEQATTESQQGGFAALGLGESTLSVVSGMSFDEPTEVQKSLIPVILRGDDALVRARSGEGKTNAYILPMVERVKPDAGLQMVVLLPTGGIAARMQRNFERYAEHSGFQISIDAGSRRGEPVRNGSPDILLATPRRAARHFSEGPDEVREGVSLVVVDEIDAMLDMGEGESIESVLEAVGGESTQTVILSGELTDEIEQFAEQHLRSPQRICPPAGRTVAERTRHACYHVTEDDPFDALVSFCKQKKPRLGLVYAADEDAAYELLDRLRRVRVECRGLNERGRPGRRDRGRRDSAVIVIAGEPPRQLSTMPFSHVLHYALPDDIDGYAARLAQCDRLNRRGASIIFVEQADHPLIEQIEALTGSSVEMLEPLVKPERSRDRGDRGGRRDSRSSGPRREHRAPPPAQDDDSRGNVAPETDTQPAIRKTLGGRHKPRGRSRRMW